MSRPLNSLNPMDRRKQRIDDLAASAAGPRTSDREPASGSVLVVDDAGTVDEAPGVSLIASAWRRPAAGTRGSSACPTARACPAA